MVEPAPKVRTASELDPKPRNWKKEATVARPPRSETWRFCNSNERHALIRVGPERPLTLRVEDDLMYRLRASVREGSSAASHISVDEHVWRLSRRPERGCRSAAIHWDQ